MIHQAKIIENRLDKANVRCSESQTANKALRDQIDDLRRERVVFEQVFKRLQKDLKLRRTQLDTLVEKVNKTY